MLHLRKLSSSLMSSSRSAQGWAACRLLDSSACVSSLKGVASAGAALTGSPTRALPSGLLAAAAAELGTLSTLHRHALQHKVLAQRDESSCKETCSRRCFQLCQDLALKVPVCRLPHMWEPAHETTWHIANCLLVHRQTAQA